MKDVRLRDCKKISDKGLFALAVNLPGITSIDLCLTSHVTCAGVTAVAVGCPALVKISLTASCLSTFELVALNDSIFAIARGCPKLQTFSIRFCIEVTDHSVAFLADSFKECNLSGCERVTDDAIRVVPNSCSDLKELDIAGRSWSDERGNRTAA